MSWKAVRKAFLWEASVDYSKPFYVPAGAMNVRIELGGMVTENTWLEVYAGGIDEESQPADAATEWDYEYGVSAHAASYIHAAGQTLGVYALQNTVDGGLYSMTPGWHRLKSNAGATPGLWTCYVVYAVEI